MEGVYSDSISLFSLNQLVIYLGHVLKFDLSKELPEILVKNKDSWTYSRPVSRGEAWESIFFLPFPEVSPLCIENNSEYKSYLVSGILIGLWIRAYC